MVGCCHGAPHVAPGVIRPWPSNDTYLSHHGSPMESARSLSYETRDFCTRRHNNTGAAIGPHTPLVPPKRCPFRRAALALPREHPSPSRLYPPATWPWRTVPSSVGVRAPFMGDVQISYMTSIGFMPPSRAGLA